MVKFKNIFPSAYKKHSIYKIKIKTTICFMKYANIHIKRSEKTKLGILLFCSFTYRATFISRIQNEPSTCIHERPGIEMKQKNLSDSC